MHQFEKTWSPYDRMGQISQKRIKTLWRSMGLSNELASLVRYEFDMLLLKLFNTISFRFRRKLKKLKNQTNLKIQLGCGRNVINDWVNIDCYAPKRHFKDVIVFDVRGGLPFEDGAADFIFSEHFFEHVDRQYIPFLLRECHRVLSVNGAIRIILPDGGKLLRAYSVKEHPLRSLFPLADDMTWMDFVNSIARGTNHKYLYDEETIIRDLANAGFHKVEVCDAGESEFLQLVMDDPDLVRRASSIYLEALKE